MTSSADKLFKPIDDKLVARLMPKVTPRLAAVGECLEWSGAKTKTGYGIVSLHKYGNFRVHRVAYVAANGEIPPGLVIDHLCKNRACCNAQHMEAVTASENSHRTAKGVCGRGHIVAGYNKYMHTNGQRFRCRECLMINSRKNSVRRRARRALARAMRNEESQTNGS